MNLRVELNEGQFSFYERHGTRQWGDTLLGQRIAEAMVRLSPRLKTSGGLEHMREFATNA